ncbi:Methylthioribulose-1-phosphate dehydratase [Xylophilus ampelinus]|nr:class II aldolase [Variovorax sp.]VTY36713.1 Methylthioribulose-1-phosphate dehydratase [Xylophilus ampelinus]|tara:strand:+ start:3672 stop:4670 length:999 start_codon:yes stop_codon:yes gene_type:complete
MREEIQALSARLGADPMLVQGAGGNISWKEDGRLWVKASGARMQDALVRDIFVPVNLKQARDPLAPARVDPIWNRVASLRPSIETSLHALMPQRVVAHLHSVDFMSRLVRRSCRELLNDLLRDRRHALVPYHKPGTDLAASVHQLVREQPNADVLLLTNHGIVVAANSAEELDLRLTELVSSLANNIRPIARAALTAQSAAPHGYRRPADPAVDDLALDAVTFDFAQKCWAITPDHVVFLGASSNALTDRPERASIGAPLEFFIVRGDGVFIRDDDAHRANMIEEMLRCYRDVAVRIDDLSDVALLKDHEVMDLLGWEAEQYRQKLNGVVGR